MEYQEFWKSFFDFEDRDVALSGEVKVSCPFHLWNTGHDDDNPSMSINLDTGMYKCFSCPDGTPTTPKVIYDFSKQSRFLSPQPQDASSGTGDSGDTFTGGMKLRAAGDAEAFVMAYFDVKFPAAKAYVAIALDDGDLPLPFSEEIVLEWQSVLQSTTSVKDFLIERKGLDSDTIRRYELGWDAQTGRITIPVRNYRGDIVNVRKYDPGLKKAKLSGKAAKVYNKMISLSPIETLVEDQVYVVRYGEARLYPGLSSGIPLGATNICSMHLGDRSGSPEVFLMAGEWDCMLARQYGLNAFTMTGGEGAWRSGWDAWFAGCKVYVCYDSDKVGKQAAISVAGSLQGSGIDVLVVHLPLSGDKSADDKDFSDWILKTSPASGREVYESLVEFAKVYAPPSRPENMVRKGTESVHEVSLVEASYNPHYQGSRTRIRATVTGKDLTPYTIVKEARFTCDKMEADNPLCKGCAINFASGTLDVSIDANQDVLRLIKCSDEQAQAALMKIVSIPGKCPKWEMEEISSQNVEQVFVSPEVEAGGFTSLDTEHTMQDAYYVYAPGEKRLEANQTYVMEGVRTTEPWKQHVVHIVDNIEPVQDTVQAFVIDEKVRDNLVRFRNDPQQALSDKFDGIARSLARDVTHIYGRDDLVVGILLTYVSAQQFYFQGQRVDNGLVETLVIGDTRTGKSETAFRLAAYFGLGDVVTGEATTFAGLVGGLQAGVDGHWVVTWGKIPRNNGKLLVIDEVSGLRTDEIERMSGIRSSRIAELVKIVQARTNARTRLLWLSNPRENRPLRSYSHGIEAVPILIGKPEDVARFDLVLSCASGEVSDEIINQLIAPSNSGLDFHAGPSGTSTSGHEPSRERNGPLDDEASGRDVRTIPREAFRDVILWAWSRKIDQIDYTQEAVTETLKSALEMGRKYSSGIPIVESANQRIKVARLAVAAAALSGSSDATQEQIVVLPEHVRFAHAFMDGAYAKPSLDYAGYSEKEKEDEHTAEREAPTIKMWASRNWAMSEFLFGLSTFRAKDLEEQMNADADQVKDAIGRLSKARMIEHTPTGYRKTATFVGVLKELRAERGSRDA